MRAGADIDRKRGRRATARVQRGGALSPTVGVDGEGARDSWAEVRHDALAALLGIEAAAQSLSRHRHLLSAGQVDELANGLVAEVDRLRSLLGGPSIAPGPADRRPARPPIVDLRDAVMPVVICARSGRQSVLVDVPADVHVRCDREVVARVLLSLLSNARRHAPGSPVEVRGSVDRDHVELRVEDRGPGVPAPLQAGLFGRGSRSQATGGSGLGLHTARQLITEQGGAIRHAPRAGGGATFVVHLPRAAPDAAGSTGGTAGAGGPGGGMAAGGVPTGEVPAVP